MSGSFSDFSADEVGEGLRFGKERFGIYLDRDTLRRLANETGKRWYAGGKRPGHLVQAKRQALDNDLWIRDRCDQDRRNAYSSVVSKMFSLRAQFRKKPRTKLGDIAQKPARIDPTILYGEAPDGQFTFLFPHQ
ncbi:MAG: hypothetical protein Q8O19_00855 [Rectinemataceae bacterium]|nr:hypothetical protein [Rectinemataceae bacterium]